MTFEANTNVGATLTRLSLGTILLAHGLLKLFVFTLPGTVAFFAGLGLPAIVAYLTIFAEVVGGVAIIAGLYTRLAAILSLPVLLGSLWAHAGNGWLFSGEGGGWEFPALLVALAVAVAIQGGGAFALRRLPVIDAYVPQALKA
ncbi:DoxX family protein [Primorskyibacter marinus]|uniref:DoxX family protein n=1 Tax=Primorskyibacter marinus TaxID=1977320 RepID=UPI000E30A8D7|nr:DoxX family protein [Primorskyibacter marinus]